MAHPTRSLFLCLSVLSALGALVLLQPTTTTAQSPPPATYEAEREGASVSHATTVFSSSSQGLVLWAEAPDGSANRVRLCDAPCSLVLAAGTYEFGVGVGNNSPTRPLHSVWRMPGPHALDISFESHEVERVWGWIFFAASIAMVGGSSAAWLADQSNGWWTNAMAGAGGFFFGTSFFLMTIGDSADIRVDE